MKFPIISLPTLNIAIGACDIAIGACLLCLAGLVILAYQIPTTPPEQVVPAVVAPLPQESVKPQETPQTPQMPQMPQEMPQTPQESPEAGEGKLSALDSPRLAPAAPVLPLPPPAAIEIQAEVIIKEPIAQPAPCRGGSCYPHQRRGWFRR